MEAANYKANFQSIETLIKYEEDYRVAGKECDYSFNFCPGSYECMDKFGVSDLCSIEGDVDDTVEQCKRCWKQAFKKAEAIK